MGKGAILLVLTALMVTSALYTIQDRSTVTRIESEVDYQEQVLAREAAQSAFNIVASKVKRDYEGYRGSFSDLKYKRSKYDMSATDEADGSVSISGTGRYGNHEYTIRGIVDKSGTRLLDALTLDGPLDKFEIKKMGLISGQDANPDGTTGPGPNVHAVLTTDADVQSTILGLGLNLRLVGVRGPGDVISGAPEVNLDALEDAVLEYAGARLSEFEGDRTFGTMTFGSQATPGILRVDGDLKLEDSYVGYGLAYVTGELEMKDNARWVGLIFVNNTDAKKHKMKDDSIVNGVVVLRSTEDPDSSDDAENPGKGKKVTICHYPPGNPGSLHTITIGSSALNAHLAHGDEMDACDDESGGAEKSGKSGKSSKKTKSNSIGSSVKVTMCHKPPGNPGNMHTIIIGMPARATHLAHGDEEGECENDVITGPGDPVSFEISDDARIVYSSRALKSLGNVIEQVKLEEGGITVRRTAEAPRKLTQVLRDY